MKFRAVAVGVLACAAAATAGPSRAGQPGEVAALAWLSAADRGSWGAAYETSGALFRAHTTAREWSIMAPAVRAPFGPVLSRTLISDKSSHSLPGAPDGDYLVLRFATRFANKVNSVETVALAREGAAWKVDGYFIK